MKRFISILLFVGIMFSLFYVNAVTATDSDESPILPININSKNVIEINVSSNGMGSSWINKYFDNPEIIEYFVYLLNCIEVVDDGLRGGGADGIEKNVKVKFDDNSSMLINSSYGRMNIDGKSYKSYYNTVDIIEEAAAAEIILDNISYTPSKWAEQYINSAINADIIKKANRVNYSEPIWRGEACQIIYNYMLYKNYRFAESSVNPFEDTNLIAIAKLYGSEIVNGKTETCFEPYNKLTREEFAKILTEVFERFNGEISTTSGSADFVDCDNISEWAKSYVNKVKYKGLMNGDENNKFNPQAEITKEELIAALMCIKTEKMNASDFELRFEAVDFLDDEAYYLWYLYKNGKKFNNVTTAYFGARDFSEGLAAVTLSPPQAAKQYWGYIDTNGEVVIPYFFTEAGDFSSGKATVKSDLFDEPYEIDTKGNRIDGKKPTNIKTNDRVNSSYGAFEYIRNYVPNLCSSIEGAKFNNKVLFEPSFSICGFVDGYSVVDTNFIYTDNNICGVINSDGKLILPFQYRPAYDYYVKDGIIPVYYCFDDDRELEYINLQGENIFGDKTFKSGRQFTEGYAAVKIEGEYEALPFAFREKGDKWTYIDKNGEFATAKIFNYAEPFHNGYAKVVIDDETYKINKKFEIVEDLGKSDILY